MPWWDRTVVRIRSRFCLDLKAPYTEYVPTLPEIAAPLELDESCMPSGDAIAVSGDFRMFGMSDSIEAMTGVRADLRELAMAGPRNEVAGRTMIDMDDLLLDLVDTGPVAPADIAMLIVMDTDTLFDHRSVLTDYALS